MEDLTHRSVKKVEEIKNRGRRALLELKTKNEFSRKFSQDVKTNTERHRSLHKSESYSKYEVTMSDIR